MGLPVSGQWAASNANANQYAGALKWGTGNNPIHSVYGEGPPLRSTGRQPGPDMPTTALSDVPPSLETAYDYGYTMEDVPNLVTFYGQPPPVGTDTGAFRDEAGNFPHRQQYGEDDDFPLPVEPAGTNFRTVSEGARVHRHTTKQFPTETVTEGWRNKETSIVLDADVSDPSQYERQTSMQQVNPAAGRNNDGAVLRATDDPRFNIMTRLTGMKVKPWSGGQRHADMFPFQSEMIVRPFTYRTGATGDPYAMAPNEMYVSDPIERTPPPDPDLGPEETNVTGDYGYTSEDVTYA